MSKRHESQTVASIALCTRNRRDCALRAVESAFKQTGCGEVIVIDDGSDDGTSDAIRKQFPSVRLHRFEKCVGVGAVRSQYIRLARYAYIVAIDDDAYFDDPNTVLTTLGDFQDARIGAIAMPMLDSGQILQPPAPDGQVYLTRYFYGGAHALRRDIASAIGAYRSDIRFYTEESDICIRMLDKGYVTAVGSASPVLHVSPGDQKWPQRRRALWATDVLFKWHYTPWPYLPVAMLSHSFNHGCVAWREGHFRDYLLTTAQAMFTAFRRWNDRQPVNWRAYRVWRTLARRRMAPLSELEAALPPMQDLSMPGQAD